MPALGSAKPREPPAPGDRTSPRCRTASAGLGFMKPSENRTSPFMHSSWKPRAGGIAGADSTSSVSGRRPSRVRRWRTRCTRARCARGADAPAGRHFEVAGIDALGRQDSSSQDSRSAPGRCSSGDSTRRAAPEREPEQHVDAGWWGKRRQPGVRDRLGQADVEVESQWRGDLVLEELAQAAMLRIERRSTRLRRSRG